MVTTSNGDVVCTQVPRSKPWRRYGARRTRRGRWTSRDGRESGRSRTSGTTAPYSGTTAPSSGTTAPHCRTSTDEQYYRHAPGTKKLHHERYYRSTQAVLPLAAVLPSSGPVLPPCLRAESGPRAHVSPLSLTPWWMKTIYTPPLH